MGARLQDTNSINVWGARVNNLKNIDVKIPRNSLTVITGLSGSGKSSLAFDTLFAEGQRRFMETFSPYVRNFIGEMTRPDVDKITGLGPVISIAQKTTSRNPRSTVGTITEIYDLLRLLFSRVSTAYSFATGEKMVKYTSEEVLEKIIKDHLNERLFLLAPIVKGRKGHYRELFESVRKKGYLHVRVDEEIVEITRGMKTDRYKNHDIEVVVDRLLIKESDKERLAKSLNVAMKMGDGLVMTLNKDSKKVHYYSERLMCPTTGMAYKDPTTNTFSFNSPQGACTHCNGLGVINDVDIDKIIPNKKKSIAEGAITPLGKYRNQMIFWQIESILKNSDYNIKTPIEDINEETMKEILQGSLSTICIDKELIHTSNNYFTHFDGVLKYLYQILKEDKSASAQKWINRFTATKECPFCQGKRLNKEALSFKIWDKNIAELSDMSLFSLDEWLKEAPNHMDKTEQYVSKEILKEIKTRTSFLFKVGLGYLSLSRSSTTLSGGEAQRLRLATQIGSKLVNVLYILDEPSIGLHPKDNTRLITSLKELRDIGNTVIVVEHDKDTMLAADYIIDLGPGAGRKGGEIMFSGTPKELFSSTTAHISSPTARFLLNKINHLHTPKRRKGNGKYITIRGASGNNLKHIDVSFPLGKLTVVTGVSGSGKSSIVNGTLKPLLSQFLYHSENPPLKYNSIEGIEYINKVVNVDQSPIGRTPRSNAATYTGVFNDIRNLFATLPEAKIRGYKPNRFSFNVKGGRCETCGGAGYKTVEMKFLPDITVKCEDCQTKRYNRETLEIKYKGKNIADILDMTVNNAVEFFDNQPEILHKIKALKDVGLGYIKLGQSATTLSGGESQRIKLASELKKKDTGKTVYILDEPTTGLHFDDIQILMNVINQLVDRGNTAIIIEHNTTVMVQADHIIDLGPQAGEDGGYIINEGTPEEVALSTIGYTPYYLKKELENLNQSKL